MKSDAEQQSVNVPQHKRLAQGVKLDGTSYQPKGQQAKSGQKSGGLAHLKKK